MDSVRNPYTPHAGASPEIIVGRDDLFASFRMLLRRLAIGRTHQSMIVTGLRGVGKTVLLNLFAEVAREETWEAVEVEASKFDDEQFRQALHAHLRAALLHLSPRARWGDRARRAAAAIAAFGITSNPDGQVSLRWDVDTEEGLADHQDLALDLTDVLVALGEAAREQGRGVVLLIDEIQFLRKPQLEALIMALHKTVQRKLPVTLVGAGLPQAAELAGDAKSYSERLFTFPELGSLSDVDAGSALADPAEKEGAAFAADAVELGVQLTQGYPYFIQELGYQAWEIASGGVITVADVTAAQEAYEAKLDSSFFRVRLDRATPLQTAYLRAMAQLGPEPQRASDVAKVMGREATQVAPTRAELINMGLLYTPGFGTAAFTVPDFDKYMMRAVPILDVPDVRPRRPSRTRDE